MPMQVKSGALALLAFLLGVLGCMLLARVERNAEREADLAAVRNAYPQQAPSAAAAAPASSPIVTATERSEIVALRLQMATLQGELAAARDEARRQRDGLERAVAELNRLQLAAATVPSARVVRPAAVGGRVSLYSPPEVRIVGETLLVTGRVYNSGDTDATGTLQIELLLDGRTLDTAYEHLMVPARNAMAFAHTFQRWPQEGTYSARVKPSY